MMTIIETSIEGLFMIENSFSKDDRGAFCKVFHKEFFQENGLCVSVGESFYTVSNKDVVRGMHFQVPPFDLDKLVYVTNGKILDVVLDLRKGSSTYQKCESFEISSDNRRSVYIPRGLAHGFKSLDDNTITVYNVSKGYSPKCDSGVKWNSFGFDWGIDDPIISERDRHFKSLNEFKSPF